MSWDSFTDGAMRLLEKSLTWRVRNQEIIASNIANLDTPGYTRKDMDFDHILERYSRGNLMEVSLTRTDADHLQASETGGGLVQESWDEVDLDKEMVRMAQNQISYNASVQMLIKKLEYLKIVIDGDAR